MRETIFHRLMAVQTQFPNMSWDFDEYGFLVIKANVFPEEREALENARKMFSPA